MSLIDRDLVRLVARVYDVPPWLVADVPCPRLARLRWWLRRWWPV